MLKKYMVKPETTVVYLVLIGISILISSCSYKKTVHKELPKPMVNELATSLEDAVILQPLSYTLYVDGVECADCATLVCKQLQQTEGIRDVKFVCADSHYSTGWIECVWSSPDPFDVNALHEMLLPYGFGIHMVKGKFTGVLYQDEHQPPMFKVSHSQQTLCASSSLDEMEPFDKAVLLSLSKSSAQEYEATVWFNEVTESYWITPTLG